MLWVNFPGGASQLYQGSSELTNGVSSAQDGVVQLDDGVASAKEELDGAISETSEKLKATDGLETYTANGVSVQADPYEAVPNYGTRICTILYLSVIMDRRLIHFDEHILRTKQKNETVVCGFPFQSNQNVCFLRHRCTSSGIAWHCWSVWLGTANRIMSLVSIVRLS